MAGNNECLQNLEGVVAIFMRLKACAKAWMVSLCLTKHISC